MTPTLEATDRNAPSRRAAAGHAAGSEIVKDRARLEAGAVQELLTRLEQLKRELQGVLAAAAANSFRQFTASGLVTEIDQLIADATAEIAALTRPAFTQASDLGTAAAEEPIKAARINVSPRPGLDRALVTSAFDLTADLLTEPMQAFRNQIVRGVRQAALAGDSSYDKLRDLAGSIGAEGFDGAKFKAERIIRTELGRVLSSATFDRLVTLAAEMPFLRKGWRATRDGRTRQGHVMAAAQYARGQGIPISEKFAIQVHQERDGVITKTLGIAYLRFPIDPLAEPAGRLAAGATIMCRCNAFVDFNLADLAAFAAQRTTFVVPPPSPDLPGLVLPPPFPLVRVKKPKGPPTAVQARAKLAKMKTAYDAKFATMATASTDAHGAWIALDSQIRNNPEKWATVSNAVERDRLEAAYRGLSRQLLAFTEKYKAAARRAVYVDLNARRSIPFEWYGRDVFAQGEGWHLDARGRKVTTISNRAGARKRITEGFREAARLIGYGSLGTKVLIKRARDVNTGDFVDRAFANDVNNSINLSMFERTDVVVHELGHLLEYNSPDVQAATHRFLAIRQAGGTRERLMDLYPGYNYKPHEWTIKDEFKNGYTGKEYIDGNGRRYATEVLSMGLQEMHNNPGKFALEDPDFFDFMYDVVRGRFRGVTPPAPYVYTPPTPKP
jgi:hypothetical protein